MANSIAVKNVGLKQENPKKRQRRRNKEITHYTDNVKNNTIKEKRLYPRVFKRFPIDVWANGYDFVTYTQNLSCLGAYCYINKYIPPFTKVKVKLNLPIMKGGIKEDWDVECNGVIVRTEDELSGGFNIAIFFNGIREQSRQKLSRYVSQFLP